LSRPEDAQARSQAVSDEELESLQGGTLKSRGSLSIWLDKEMAWFVGGAGKRGRSPTYSDAAI